VNAGIGGMGEPWAGGSGSSRIPLRVSQRAAEAAGQLDDPVHGGIRRPSVHLPFRSEDFPPWTEQIARASGAHWRGNDEQCRIPGASRVERPTGSRGVRVAESADPREPSHGNMRTPPVDLVLMGRSHRR
jgi:hypothetical protein